MKRTVVLIGILIIVAVSLLAIALSVQYSNKQNTQPTPTKKVTQDLEPPATTQLSLSPTVISLESSRSAIVDVTIDTGNNKVTAVQLEIAYDPKVLSEVTIEPGTFLKNAFVLLNTNDKLSGRISYALALPPAQEPLTGSGQVATIHVTKKAILPTGLNAQQTTLTILPKSLVSDIHAQRSVLKQTSNATIMLGSSENQKTTTIPSEQ